MLNSIIGCLGYNWTLSIHPFRDINRQICVDVDPHSYDPLSLINIIVNRPINRYVRMVKRADGSSTSSFSSIISLLWCTVGVARLEGPSTHVIYRRFCCFFSFRFSFFFLVLVLVLMIFLLRCLWYFCRLLAAVLFEDVLLWRFFLKKRGGRGHCWTSFMI